MSDLRSVGDPEFINFYREAYEKGLSQTELGLRIGCGGSSIERRRKIINRRRGYTVLKKLPAKRGRAAREARAVAARAHALVEAMQPCKQMTFCGEENVISKSLRFELFVTQD